MNLKYKPSTSKDIPILYEYSKKLIDQYEEIENIDYEKVLKWVYKKIEMNIHEYTSIYLEDILVGYYRFHEDENKMELDDFYIFETYQNKGIGSMVLKKCIQETNKNIFLYVFKKNINAIRLYERFEFKIIKNIQNSRYIMER